MQEVLSNRPATEIREGIGQRVKRREDPQLITGQGSYIDDYKCDDLLYVKFIRSSRAHATIKSIDMSKVTKMPAVRLVLTGFEVNREVQPLPVLWDTAGLRNRENVCLAENRVRYVGQPIALLVAESAYLAEDAASLVEVVYESLPPVIDAEIALADEAPLLYEEWGTNETCEPIHMSQGDCAKAFAEADRVIEARLYSHRYSGFPLETRGCVASYDERKRVLTVHSSTQAPNQVRTGIAHCLGMGESQISVRAGDVGGGFGVKDQVYPEEIIVSYIARRLKKTIKWIEDRTESFGASTHAREQVHDVQLALKDDGTLLALRDRILYDAGAHHTSRGALPALLTASMLPGPYRLIAAEIDLHVVVTNKVPSGAYRGFGMTQATFVMERMLDIAASELGLEPAELREKNFIQPEQVSTFVTATGTTYDSGDYPQAFKRVLDLFDYAAERKRQVELRKQKRYLGIGLASFVENTALGPSKFQAFIGFLIPSHEISTIVMDMTGHVTVHTGIMPIGQGTQTSLSQIVVDTLGVSLDEVRIVYGDTDACPYSGLASVASRGTAVGGAVLLRASEHIQMKLKRIASNMLEAAVDDIELRRGYAFVRGFPEKGVPLREIARAAYFGDPRYLPEGEDPGLSHTEMYNPKAVAFAYASHACLVEVDPESGFVEVLKYAVVHDCGTMVNPMIIEGQIHGGVVQGLGGALMEELPYDDKGQLLNQTFDDYRLPRASGIPEILIEHMETPSPFIPGGFKGAGEGGAIGSTAAVANAVADALLPYGVKITSTPLTPERVWKLIHSIN